MLRQGKSLPSAVSATYYNSEMASKAAAQIEFLALDDNSLKNGNILTMSNVQKHYESISEANNVENSKDTMKMIKQVIRDKIEDVEFRRPKKVNESERITIKTTCDFTIQLSEDNNDEADKEIKTLFDKAKLLRKAINKSKSWVFTG